MTNKFTVEVELLKFRDEKSIKSKGALAVVLQISRLARNKGLPLNAEKLLTKGGGQVLGLSKDNVQSILADYGISQILAEEGGRTSRGSIAIMQQYVLFLNKLVEKNHVSRPTESLRPAPPQTRTCRIPAYGSRGSMSFRLYSVPLETSTLF